MRTTGISAGDTGSDEGADTGPCDHGDVIFIAAITAAIIATSAMASAAIAAAAMVVAVVDRIFNLGTDYAAENGPNEGTGDLTALALGLAVLRAVGMLGLGCRDQNHRGRGGEKRCADHLDGHDETPCSAFSEPDCPGNVDVNPSRR